VVWTDERARADATTTVYAQRVSSSGVPMWASDGVPLCTATGFEMSPTLIGDGLGGAIVTWFDQRTAGDDDIYAQRISASGIRQWVASGAAVCTAPQTQSSPTIVSDGAGGAIITWFDLRSATNTHIYAQRMNALSVPMWSANGVAVCTAPDNQARPTIASDGARGAIITWIDHRNGNDDIFAQRIDSTGTCQWAANGVPVCTAAFDQQYPQIVSDGVGGGIITWMDRRSGNFDIYAQRVSSTGVDEWTADGIAVCTAAQDQTIPLIVRDGAGGAIITWGDDRAGSHIFAQRIDAGGNVKWAHDGAALCTAPGGQFDPTIASDDSGGAVLSWDDTRDGTFHIYAQRVSSLGMPLWTSGGAAICTASVGQTLPLVTSDGAGGATIAWTDSRNDTLSGTDIYAQGIQANGQLGGNLAGVGTGEPAVFALTGAWPNPVVGKEIVVQFELPTAAHADLDLVDVSGRRIARYEVGEMGAGRHSVRISARGQLSPGVYFVRLVQGTRIQTARLVLLN